MEQRRGTTATIGLLAATLLGVSYLPRKGAETSAVPENPGQTQVSTRGTTSAPNATNPEDEPKAPCLKIARHLERFSSDDVTSSSDDRISPVRLHMPEHCFPEGKRIVQGKLTLSPDLRFAIAIVPNPVQTHLPLLFDRSVEAIEQAARDENYTYDSSWFPWDDKEEKYQSITDTHKAVALQKEQQQEPGISLEGCIVPGCWELKRKFRI